MTFQVASYVIKCLIRVWNIKYNSVHCAANLLAGLAQYYVSNHWSYLIHLSHDHFCLRNTLKANNQKVLWLLYVFLDVSTAVFFLSFFFFFLSFFFILLLCNFYCQLKKSQFVRGNQSFSFLRYLLDSDFWCTFLVFFCSSLLFSCPLCSSGLLYSLNHPSFLLMILGMIDAYLI